MIGKRASLFHNHDFIIEIMAIITMFFLIIVVVLNILPPEMQDKTVYDNTL